MKPDQFIIPQQYLVGEIKIDTTARLDRTYLRLLVDAFVPYQEAMLASLDELMAKHAPQRVQDQLKAVDKESQKKSREWKQIPQQFAQADEAGQEKILDRLEDLHNEQSALSHTCRELGTQLDLATRSQSIVQRKREDILKLLQSRQAMIEEGTWENIGGKDKMSHVFSIIGDESYGFGFSNITLQGSPINDIFDWMTHYHPEVLPSGNPFPASAAPSQAMGPEKKEAASPPTTEFLHIPDEVTASIRTFLAIRRPGYSLLSLLDRSDEGKRAWLAHLSRTRHDQTVERVSDVVIELTPQQYMTIQNVQELPATPPSPDPQEPA